MELKEKLVALRKEKGLTQFAVGIFDDALAADDAFVAVVIKIN